MKNTKIAAVEKITSIQKMMEAHPDVSIRKIALATKMTYSILLNASKKPIEGMPYNPEFVNYAALQEKFDRKGINVCSLDWEAMSESVKRGAQVVKDMSAFTVGCKVYLRTNTLPYEVVYKTSTHIVLMLEGTTEPLAWSNNTFLLRGPSFEARESHEE